MFFAFAYTSSPAIIKSNGIYQRSAECQDQSPQVELNENQRFLLIGLLDEIIPASDDGRIQSAGSLHIADFIVEKYLEVSGFGELLIRGLEKMLNALEARRVSFYTLPRKDRIALVKELERQEPDFFTALVRYTYIAYYTDPQIPQCFTSFSGVVLR